jgi:hypothetical protein
MVQVGYPDIGEEGSYFFSGGQKDAMGVKWDEAPFVDQGDYQVHQDLRQMTL